MVLIWPIMLTNSKSGLEIIKLLLKAKAPMDAKVTRGSSSHYDVLHAAVFAEGRPASTEIVAFLLENKSDPGGHLYFVSTLEI